ncbi:hypothetical protein AB0F72_09280 [Actinoplanes sp. NPDC023936]|uniref:hypothetical protein n=1 Tax=Actinoplanes sp. NPDC023936 TaxID=3154910 RepID=UPI0033E048A6
MNPEDGPTVQICQPHQVADTSKALGLPVVGADRDGPHDVRCGGCGGEKTDQDCPYSVRMRAYVDSLPWPPSQGGPTSTEVPA